MTVSEIFAVMVGGYSTVSGSVLAAYIGFGVFYNYAKKVNNLESYLNYRFRLIIY